MTELFYCKQEEKDIMQYEFDKEQAKRRLGKLLLQHALVKVGNSTELIIRRNKYGKPFLAGSSIYYNISHSDKIVACCISDSEVGIDVQKYVKLDKNVVNFFWNKADFDRIKNIDIKSIINVWAQKEAVAKCLGYGLQISFKDIFLDEVNEELYIANVRGVTLFLRRAYVHENYACWVAKEERINSINIKSI